MNKKIMKVITYWRKSTDRDDKQANSLEHQLDNCRKTIKSNDFEVIKEILESRSAKIEWTRPWFKELIKICKTWKVDYIIIDEPKRLSRNNRDTSDIIDLLDKNQIKWIIWTNRQYMADNSRDKFLLQLDLSLSKMDNEDRSKDVKDKMTSCVNNTRRFLGKAPFWYNNITIKKWHKEIVINDEEAKIVKEIYSLRLEKKAFSTIAIIIKEKYWNRFNINLQANRIQGLIKKTFYYWMFTWWGKDIIWSHKPLISKDIYDKANWIWKGTYENNPIIDTQIRTHRKYILKWFVKDTSWILLCSYIKKWHTYYLNQQRSNEKININENIIFEKFWTILKSYDSPNIFKDIDKDIILELLREKEWSDVISKDSLDLDIKKIEKNQGKLLDMRLNEKISEELYLMKNNNFENDIKELEEQKLLIKNDDFEEKTQILIELAGSLYWYYSNSDIEWKALIMKKLLIELFVDTKKELQIQESPLFKSSKMLNIFIGTPTENWTPVPALRRPCPNH